MAQLYPVVHNHDDDVESLTRCPDEEEIKSTVKVMKNNKAPSADNITAELLKLGGDVVVQWLLNLVSMVWQEKCVPEDWTKAAYHPTA